MALSFQDIINQATSNYEANRSRMAEEAREQGLLRYTGEMGEDIPELEENPDLVEDWGYNPNKSEDLGDMHSFNFDKPNTDFIGPVDREVGSDRFERARQRALDGKVIVDPMYRNQLKQQGHARPRLKDYKFGSGDWMDAMQDWRSTPLNRQIDPNEKNMDLILQAAEIDNL